MFAGCTSLHKYSASTVDKTFARVDQSGAEGYFEYPSHENLYEYTLGELKVVSDYLTKNYSEESQDSICIKFRTFRDSGLTTYGTDNGVAMKADFTCH